MSLIFFITALFCVKFLHILQPLQRRVTQLLFSSHSWLIEGREDADAAGQIRSLKLCDVPYSAGAAELWKQDCRWAWLGWGPFKSNRIASVLIPVLATLSEQITCSSKGYDSPWHLCWDPAFPDPRVLCVRVFSCAVSVCMCSMLKLFIMKVGKSKQESQTVDYDSEMGAMNPINSHSAFMYFRFRRLH